MEPTPETPESGAGLDGLRVAIVGRLASMSRRDAQKLLRSKGAVPVDPADANVGLVVLGEGGVLASIDELATAGAAGELLRQAVESGRVETCTETQLWQRLGLVDEDAVARRLYTPAMLADLLGIAVSVVRRWHRRGLIRPVREVCRLPYFDFQEVLTARKLAAMLASGMSPQAIERKLKALARLVPDVERPLAQLAVIVQDKDLLLREGGGLIDSSGQMRIDFEPMPEGDAGADSLQRATLPLVSPLHPKGVAESSGVKVRDCGVQSSVSWTQAAKAAPETCARDSAKPSPFAPMGAKDLCSLAMALEDEERLREAADAYRAALAAGGPTADLCFRLAEVLYRLGQVEAACERYYMALELDEEFVEARANLGCVLAETGRLELAAAAFEGALRFHPDYADVHYHLAQVLDDLGQTAVANSHYRRFLALAPASPWASMASERLQTAPTETGG